MFFSQNVWRKIKEKNNELADKKKWVKAVEQNKLAVMIKRLLSEFNLYGKFMRKSKENDKNKRT